jgi:hypothetical protein
MHRRVLTVAVLAFTALTLTACGNSNPAAPSTPPPPTNVIIPPTTAILKVRLDAACSGINLRSATIYLDGENVGSAADGGELWQVVSIGTHSIEAAAYYSNGVQGYHWGPYSVYVPAIGYSELFYCK